MAPPTWITLRKTITTNQITHIYNLNKYNNNNYGPKSLNPLRPSLVSSITLPESNKYLLSLEIFSYAKSLIS